MQNYIHAAPETGENLNMFTTWLLKFVFLAPAIKSFMVGKSKFGKMFAMGAGI